MDPYEVLAPRVTRTLGLAPMDFPGVDLFKDQESKVNIAIRWESPDMDPYEVLAPKVSITTRYETSDVDAYET